MSQHGSHIQRHRAQHETHVLPITALAWLNDDIVLAGEGDFLCAYNQHNQRRLGSWRVFTGQALHGIVVEPVSKDILIYSGRFICIGTLPTEGANVAFDVQAHLAIDDWILDATFEDGHAALLTAHNALLTVQRQEPASQWTVLPRVAGSNTILYCAHIEQVSRREWLVAAGTAFGDVILWSCQRPSIAQPSNSTYAATIHYSFSAHEGSTFGVRISSASSDALLEPCKRMLASCSDDRTIRVWDISDLSSSTVDSAPFSRSTGFGSRSANDEDKARPALLAKAMGHISRIWHVRFGQSTAHGPSVKSFGEDATTITWALQKAVQGRTPPYTLVQTSVFSANAGKHIWSVASNSRGQFVVGGGDGGIACVPSQGSTPLEQEIVRPAPADATLQRASDPFKTYAFLDEHTLVMTTLRGHIISFNLDKESTTAIHTFEQLDLANYSVTSAAPGVAFIGGIGSTIYAYRKTSPELFHITCEKGKLKALLACSIKGALPDESNVTALLVAKLNCTRANLKIFTIQAQVLSSVHDFLYDLLPDFDVTDSAHTRLEHDELLSILGSKKGVAAFYKHDCTTTAESIAPILVVSLHTETITSLTWHSPSEKSSQADLLGHLFTTSRDRTYAVYAVSTAKEKTTIETNLIHQLEVPFGSHTGGLALLEDDEVVVWGFRSTQFSVFSVKTQSEVFVVECGGAHRQWAIWPRTNGLTFIWTKASQVFVKHFQQVMTRMVKSGGHGREVKSMAVQHNPDGSALVATGAQDTNIRLFLARAEQHDDMNAHQRLTTSHILRQHNTGPQHIQFTNEGQYMFSSGGFEELYVWRITQSCPVIGVGVVCESIHPRSGKSDLRIMAFEATVSGDEQWQITMAYSDSRVAIWSYRRAKGWTHCVEADYLTSCPTSILPTSMSQVSSLMTATDGHIAVWQNDDSMRWTRRHRAHQGAILCSSSCRLSNGELVATGGDDNAVAFTMLHSDGGIATHAISRAHAAAVTALEIVSTQQQGMLYIISAGLDQRIILWDLDIGTKARKLQVIHSSVADISSMGLLPGAQGTVRVLVSGIGMEVWTIPLADPSST